MTPFAERHDLGLEVAQADALVAALAEDERLAVLEDERACRPCVALSVTSSKAPSLKTLQFWRISTNDAPRCSWARRSDLLQVLGLDVDAARDEARLGAERERDRVERMVDGAERRRLGHLADLGRRRVLALGEAVDAVVEEQDLQVDVAAQHVDQVVAADRERVAVAGDHPDRQLRPRHLEPGGDRRRAAVDGVEAVGVHVVREAARAADARDEDEVLARRRRARAAPSAPARGWRSRRSRGTSGRPGRRRSPSCVSFCSPAPGALMRRLLRPAVEQLGAARDDLGDLERPALHLVEADRVDQVLGAEEPHELARGSSRGRARAGSGRGCSPRSAGSGFR